MTGQTGTANTDGAATVDRVAAVTKSPPLTVAQSRSFRKYKYVTNREMVKLK